jgi:hypothetical protein
MRVRFDWQVVNEEETIVQETPRDRFGRLRKVPWWVWCAALAVLVTGALAVGLGVRQRYQAAQRRISFQIQSVIDLEARAFANAERARDLFLAQQDETSRRWYVQQEQRARRDCWRILPDQEAQRVPCTPVLPAQLTRVELQGDVAWVEVREDEPPVHRVRFYRQTERGWVHTAPRESFWGEKVTLRSDPFVARYHERDEPHVRPYLDRMQEIAAQVCGVLECLSHGALELDFTVDTPAFDAPYLVSEQRHRGSDKLLLSSPWLSGISADGGAPDKQLDRFTYWATYAIAARAVRASTEQDLNRLQEALLHEVAAWTSSQDPSQAPILGRIVERHGVEALPEILRLVPESRTLTALLDRWLALSVGDGQLVYFQTLLNIEREALLAGRKETFLLLQHPVYPWWTSDQELLFERWRQRDPALDLPIVRVRRVERIGIRARVALADPSRSLEGYPPAAKSVVYWEDVDGDWRHASPFSAAIFWAFLPERRPAGTVTPPLTPTPGPNSSRRMYYGTNEAP